MRPSDAEAAALGLSATHMAAPEQSGVPAMLLESYQMREGILRRYVDLKERRQKAIEQILAQYPDDAIRPVDEQHSLESLQESRQRLDRCIERARLDVQDAEQKIMKYQNGQGAVSQLPQSLPVQTPQEQKAEHKEEKAPVATAPAAPIEQLLVPPISLNEPFLYTDEYVDYEQLLAGLAGKSALSRMLSEELQKAFPLVAHGDRQFMIDDFIRNYGIVAFLESKQVANNLRMQLQMHALHQFGAFLHTMYDAQWRKTLESKIRAAVGVHNDELCEKAFKRMSAQHQLSLSQNQDMFNMLETIRARLQPQHKQQLFLLAENAHKPWFIRNALWIADQRKKFAAIIACMATLYVAYRKYRQSDWYYAYMY